MIEVIEYYNWLISDWFRGYYGDGVFFLLAIVAFVYLYVSCKELRYKFLLPIFLMLFITVNPILYMYIFQRIIYWRLLWMLPTAILIATAVVVLLKRINKVWMKWGLFLVISMFLASQGQYVFGYGVFFPRSNWEKVSQETIEVCDYVLSVDEAPRVVVPQSIFSEVRQYAPEISMMYGRNAHGYITDIIDAYADVYQQMESEEPDYNVVLYWANHYKFNFIVVNEMKEINTDILGRYDYTEIGDVSNYIIYYNETLE